MWNDILFIILLTLLAPIFVAIRLSVTWYKIAKKDLIIALLAGFAIGVGRLIYRLFQ